MSVEQQLEQALALAANLARTSLRERFEQDCDLVGFSGSGRCVEPAVALKWEHGFPDLVCEEHARRATDRGALVVRADG